MLYKYSMLKYKIHDILEIENNILNTSFDTSNNILNSNYLDNDVINLIYTIEYKFKERKTYKSKYYTPKPVSFSDIRINLNKLSNKSYSLYFKQIISILHVLNKDDSIELFENIYLHISCNRFISIPYSNLSSSLIEIFPEYHDLFYIKNNLLIDSLKNIDISELKRTNDIFECNKIKDNIKANIIFFANTLVKINNTTIIIKNIIDIQNLFINLIENKLKETTEKCELLSELILLYIKHTIQLIYNLPIFDNILNHIEGILLKKDDKSISRKIIFNHMDIMDIYKKLL